MIQIIYLIAHILFYSSILLIWYWFSKSSLMSILFFWFIWTISILFIWIKRISNTLEWNYTTLPLVDMTALILLVVFLLTISYIFYWIIKEDILIMSVYWFSWIMAMIAVWIDNIINTIKRSSTQSNS